MREHVENAAITASVALIVVCPVATLVAWGIYAVAANQLAKAWEK